jgi:hypothetical protein
MNRVQWAWAICCVSGTVLLGTIGEIEEAQKESWHLAPGVWIVFALLLGFVAWVVGGLFILLGSLPTMKAVDWFRGGRP